MSKETACRLCPMGDRIIVKRLPDDISNPATTIVIPKQEQQKSMFGSVVSVGPGKIVDGKMVKIEGVSKGDTVIFGKYSGTEIKIDGHEYLIIREDDVLAKVSG